MEDQLKQASIQRAKAEADLKKCGEERQKLAKDLAQCGKDRAEAEKGLAKCAAERAVLEAELKQCAEVDRPNAEKALAKCASERKTLEKELAMIAAKLKAQKGGTTSATRRRRGAVRRRRAAKSSLAQVGSSESSKSDILEGEDDEDFEEPEDVSLLALSDGEEAQLKSRSASIQQRLSELKEEAGEWESLVQTLMAKAVELAKKATGLEDKAEAILRKFEEIDQKEIGLDQTLGQVEARSEHAKSLLEEMEKLVDKATTEAETADSTMGVVQADLNKAALLQLAAQTELIELVQKTQHLRHEAVKAAHADASYKVGKVSVLLEENEELLRRDDHKECDELRGKVIRAKAKLKTASGALANCLQAKKDIQAKMDKVEVLRAQAQKALDQCLETKANLKKSLDECHHRRDSAREKLTECLDRKKVLKVKIEECHGKRDEARKKLAECLKNKKVLNEKIAAAKAQLSKTPQARLLEIEHGWEQEGDLGDALAALRAANEAFDENAELHIQNEDLIKNALESIQASSQEEAQVLEQLKAAKVAELEQGELQMKLQTTLRDAFEDLKRIQAEGDAIESESAATRKEADEAGAALTVLLQRLGL